MQLSSAHRQRWTSALGRRLPRSLAHGRLAAGCLGVCLILAARPAPALAQAVRPNAAAHPAAQQPDETNPAPTPTPSPAGAPPTPPTDAGQTGSTHAPGVLLYLAESGDTLSDIADKFKLKLATILWTNWISDPNHIQAGQPIVLPSVDAAVHVVQEGETLSALAERYQANPEAIVRLNGIDDPSLILAGVQILIPVNRFPDPTVLTDLVSRPVTATQTIELGSIQLARGAAPVYLGDSVEVPVTENGDIGALEHTLILPRVRLRQATPFQMIAAPGLGLPGTGSVTAPAADASGAPGHPAVDLARPATSRRGADQPAGAPAGEPAPGTGVSGADPAQPATAGPTGQTTPALAQPAATPAPPAEAPDKPAPASEAKPAVPGAVQASAAEQKPPAPPPTADPPVQRVAPADAGARPAAAAADVALATPTPRPPTATATSTATSTPVPPTATPTATATTAPTRNAPAANQSATGQSATGATPTPTSAAAGDRAAESKPATGAGGGPAAAKVAGTGPVDPSSLGLAAVAEAMKHLGQPYVWGGNGPTAFDCSGFTRYVYAQAGLTIPRDLAGQLTAGPAVSMKDWATGDLVFFSNTYQFGLSHSGIYIGAGKFIHAQSERVGVTISSLSDPYWSSRYTGASRPGRR